jgi:hypothetical protein
VKQLIVSMAMLAVALPALSGCVAVMTAAPPGPLQTEAKFTVDLQNNWTRIPSDQNLSTSGSMLTRHGTALERVDILTVKPGNSIVRAQSTDDAPRFRANMSELELVELVTASLNKMGFVDIKTENVRSSPLAGAPGVRFGLTGRYSSGLNCKGDVALAVSGGELNVIMFLAPASHYYAASAGEVDHFIQTAAQSSKK